ncbi:MAG: hypothetical protein WC777_01740 [Candidatus Gracilibacteria bacterium]|jgi:hypothetical protein
MEPLNVNERYRNVSTLVDGLAVALANQKKGNYETRRRTGGDLKKNDPLTVAVEKALSDLAMEIMALYEMDRERLGKELPDLLRLILDRAPKETGDAVRTELVANLMVKIMDYSKPKGPVSNETALVTEGVQAAVKGTQS